MFEKQSKVASCTADPVVVTILGGVGTLYGPLVGARHLGHAAAAPGGSAAAQAHMSAQLLISIAGALSGLAGGVHAPLIMVDPQMGIEADQADRSVRQHAGQEMT